MDHGSGINGALTAAQKDKDHTDTLESFTKDIIKSGGGRSTPELVDVLVQKSSEVSESESQSENERVHILTRFRHCFEWGRTAEW